MDKLPFIYTINVLRLNCLIRGFMMKKISILLIAALFTTSIFAHGGRTDKNGCHKESKSGERHCH